MRLDIAGYDDSRSDVEDETMMPGKREIGINDHDTGVDRNKSPYTIHFNPFFFCRGAWEFLASVNTRHGTPPIVVHPPFFFFFVLFVRRRKTGPVLGSSAGYEQTLIRAWTGISDTNNHNNNNNLTDFACSFFLVMVSALFFLRRPLVSFCPLGFLL